MHNIRRTIGYAQFIFGLLLIITALITAFFTIIDLNESYAIADFSKVYNDYKEKFGTDLPLVESSKLSYLRLIPFMISATFVYNTSIILVVLSIILILQGLLNIHLGKEIKTKPKPKKRKTKSKKTRKKRK